MSVSDSKNQAIMPSHKRSFDEFYEPLPPFKWGRPFEHNNKTFVATLARNIKTGVTRPLKKKQIRRIKPINVPLYNHALKGPPDQVTTIRNIIDNGMNPEDFISGLTNKIHPIFRKIHRCKYTHDEFCLPVRERDGGVLGKMRPVPVPQIADPLPSANLVVRTMMQLATRILTSDESLHFISALMACGKKGVKFHVHPRERLSAERKQATLARLVSYVDRIAIHFKEFSRQTTRPTIKGSLAYMMPRTVRATIPSPHIIMDVEQLNGYDSSAPGYDQLTVCDVRRTIIRGATILCHELMHAICWLEVQNYTEPIFNNEPHAEVGHAYENFVLGGILVSPPTSGGIWLRQWPVVYRLNGYSKLFRPIYVPTQYPSDQWVDESSYLRFLLDSFWDTETAPIGDRRCKPFKKLWLRTHHETYRDPQEFNFYFAGNVEAPLRGRQLKRRRLADAETKCWRWTDNMMPRLSTGGSLTSRRMRSVRYQKKKEKLEEEFREMKEDFHERELLRLNQAWEALVPSVTF
jgi:hypothetical protein